MTSQPEIGVSRFRSDGAGRVTADALQAWHREGLLVIEDFACLDQCRRLILEADSFVEDFDEEEAAAIFSTTSQQHAASDYFETSGDKIRCFFEEGAFDDNGKLVVPKSKSINKIGHALHDLNPVFECFSYQPRLANLVAQLGISEPQWLQSMLIFKQPAIGGEVTWHQDGSFLYTVPHSVIGFWFALEDASLENGCLWVLPGQHKNGLRSRFRRINGQLQTETLPEAPSFDENDGTPLEVSAGTLVVLHGALPHYSAANLSARSRYAYTLHVVSGSAEYPNDNWLQRGADLPLRMLHTTIDYIESKKV
ncbi:MAG: phytanoyl-CoA dioxygenase [Acidiferrobacteraceae bacterium]|nr:phytanoyl-CoA dioxygenase [Acidiferrobacteraceae bacterium]